MRCEGYRKSNFKPRISTLRGNLQGVKGKFCIAEADCYKLYKI